MKLEPQDSKYGIPRKFTIRQSATIDTTCVFHLDKTPSLRIWPNGRFRCYGCREHGHVKDHPELRLLFDQAHFRLLEAAGQLRLPGFESV